MHAAAQGLRVLGMKPVAAGAKMTEQGLRNDDALALQALGYRQMPYPLINPYCFAPPIAPHLAAQEADINIDLDLIHQASNQLKSECDLLVIEGAGGWLVPLGDEFDLSDLAAQLDQPIVLVVGMKLGCLNHALLTAQAIRQRGLVLAGWVANSIDPHYSHVQQNLDSLQQRIQAQLLGVIPFLAQPSARAAAGYLKLG